jgi:phosphopantothenoylcysteine decarboxylase/phosphopantothenate--cysteine ligase
VTVPAPSPLRVLITAGPTREPIDAVRYLSNHSTGRMGVELAAACASRGLPATLILGPAEHAPDKQTRVVNIVTAAEMFAAVQREFAACDVFIAAAAVADYTPKHPFSGKLKKQAAPMTLELVPTPDILKWAGENRRPGQTIVGFALESDPDPALALGKLAAKNCDLLVHNSPENFGPGGGTVRIYARGGAVAYEGTPAKRELAAIILDVVEKSRNRA